MAMMAIIIAIIIAIGIFIVAFLIGLCAGSDGDANFFCRHEWEEATKKTDKHGTYIGYVCKKCKGTRTAGFTFDGKKGN